MCDALITSEEKSNIDSSVSASSTVMAWHMLSMQARRILISGYIRKIIDAIGAAFTGSLLAGRTLISIWGRRTCNCCCNPVSLVLPQTDDGLFLDAAIDACLSDLL